MPCLLLLIVVAFPRVVLAILFLLTNYLDRAYHGLLVPLLGFFFLPLTTLAYAWIVNSHRPLDGLNLIILVLAVVFDLGGLGGGEWHRRRRYYD
jgi:UDP-N-acetylmuramyl pentapeptide phosphotransferase/UDP-N-acetylglucosamine-1-phosphate transferase